MNTKIATENTDVDISKLVRKNEVQPLSLNQ